MSEISKIMAEDSQDLINDLESTDIAEQCINLKKLEDEISIKEEDLNKWFSIRSKNGFGNYQDKIGIDPVGTLICAILV